MSNNFIQVPSGLPFLLLCVVILLTLFAMGWGGYLLVKNLRGRWLALVLLFVYQCIALIQSVGFECPPDPAPGCEALQYNASWEIGLFAPAILLIFALAVLQGGGKKWQHWASIGVISTLMLLTLAREIFGPRIPGSLASPFHIASISIQLWLLAQRVWGPQKVKYLLVVAFFAPILFYALLAICTEKENYPSRTGLTLEDVMRLSSGKP